MRKLFILIIILTIVFEGCKKNDENGDIIIDPKPKQGISAAYVDTDDPGITIEQYNSQGTVVLSLNNGIPDIRKGSIITVDLDTMGYLRRVVEVKTEGNKMTLQTVQGYLNDVFVDKDFKLSTALISQDQIVDSKGS